MIMMKRQKGQGALEYLMTYGWALLVIVVVAAALFALGVLNPATYTQSRCNGLNYFTFETQQATAVAGVGTDDYVIQIRNGNQEVEITGIGVNDGAAPTLAAPDAATVDGVDVLGTDVAPGKVIVVTVTDEAITTKGSGDSFSDLRVQIEYDIKNGITGAIDSATCTGRFA